ncbi:MAG: ABC transporter ATP-binding protein [Bacteroidetes bacterium]|nr:ABC transporter ATP-binding protein [Bacteroidota bacterium]
MLAVKNLIYRYPSNQKDTISGLNFSISKGEVFGFLGPSGSGKSTTQKILYKLLPGFSGEATFKGRAITSWNRDFYEHIGVSFELPNHYVKLTARENLQFFSSFYAKPVNNFDELLEKVGLLEDADKLVSDYSKGMKMRLNFIRALLHNPEMLFLDEPTSGLDPINAAKIKNMIRDLKAEGKTIFITTHNMFDADQLCDRVALLDQGKMIELDTPENLKRKHGKENVKVSLKDTPDGLVFPLEGLGQNPSFLKAIAEGEITSIHSQEAT